MFDQIDLMSFSLVLNCSVCLSEMIHPEGSSSGIEPTVGEELRLVEFSRGLEKLDRTGLLEIAQKLARQVLVTHPSAMRWLAREAAQNLSGFYWSQQRSDQLMDEYSLGTTGKE